MFGDRVRDEAGLGMRVQTEGGMEGQKGEGSGLNGCVHYCLFARGQVPWFGHLSGPLLFF